MYGVLFNPINMPLYVNKYGVEMNADPNIKFWAEKIDAGELTPVLETKEQEIERVAVEKEEKITIQSLRDQYHKKYGKKPFSGWKAEKLIEMLQD